MFTTFTASRGVVLRKLQGRLDAAFQLAGGLVPAGPAPSAASLTAMTFGLALAAGLLLIVLALVAWTRMRPRKPIRPRVYASSTWCRRPRARTRFSHLIYGWSSTMNTGSRFPNTDAPRIAHVRVGSGPCGTSFASRRAHATVPNGGKVIPVHGQEHPRH